MAIQDSDPERRNLVVTSLGFIVFYLADGQITSESFRLQMVPITFNNILALKVFAWSMLIWFGIRYWQTHQESFKNSYRTHITKYNTNDPSKHYLKRKLKLDQFPSDEHGFRVNSFAWHGTNRLMHIQYRLVEESTKDQPGSCSIQKENGVGPEPLTGVYGVIEHVKYFLSFSVKTDGFTSYVAPYLFFGAALLMPVVEYIKCA